MKIYQLLLCQFPVEERMRETECVSMRDREMSESSFVPGNVRIVFCARECQNCLLCFGMSELSIVLEIV